MYSFNPVIHFYINYFRFRFLWSSLSCPFYNVPIESTGSLQSIYSKGLLLTFISRIIYSFHSHWFHTKSLLFRFYVNPKCQNIQFLPRSVLHRTQTFFTRKLIPKRISILLSLSHIIIDFIIVPIDSTGPITSFSIVTASQSNHHFKISFLRLDFYATFTSHNVFKSP